MYQQSQVQHNQVNTSSVEKKKKMISMSMQRWQRAADRDSVINISKLWSQKNKTQLLRQTACGQIIVIFKILYYVIV